MKVGQVAGQKGERTPVIAHSTTRATAAKAGDFARKFPEAKRAGQDVAGEANQVKIAFGKSQAKQTWKGAREGYTTREAPKFIGAPGPMNTGSSGGGAKQKVKGKHGGAPAEAKSVAGKE